MQPGAPTRKDPVFVDQHPAVLGHEPGEVPLGGPSSAADAGPDRLRGGGVGPTRHAPDGAEEASAPGAVSGLMSMRHPVSRAASRAFWPSRPMASDSW